MKMKQSSQATSSGCKKTGPHDVACFGCQASLLMYVLLALFNFNDFPLILFLKRVDNF